MNVVHDRLTNLRDIARAQATEDFEYFANTVCGSRFDPIQCSLIQKQVEQGVTVVLPPKQQKVLDAWLVIIGRGEKLTVAPTETFQWLFAEHVEREAA